MLLVGQQEGHQACKITEWWGSGVVIRLERGADDLHNGPADAITSLSLAPVKSRMVYLSGAGLPGCPGRKAVKQM